jgi:hypothetical protein
MGAFFSFEVMALFWSMIWLAMSSTDRLFSMMFSY